ncbi:hypothetical protein [Aureimonas jatrophae]|uniref:TnsA endonuclease N terminal n=1 Tax=Aureimonas jatrophae TaxID=1166073 RepID=A0A1H0M5L2_9HYPH|nr:hypothetical protein [Aureimonas jatrophae]MBB3952616.1 hypothetical protein [Aureimonas jatrophae]SDO75655.1 hypothetical protein SAMN05192530_11276 [Aureimonas jatrophae]
MAEFVSRFPSRSPTCERRRPQRRTASLHERRVGSSYRHRCVGYPTFRSEAARDVALSLDLDPTVASWTCLPGDVRGRIGHDRFVKIRPDFLVVRQDGSRSVVDAEGLEEFAPLDPSLGYVDVARSDPLDDTGLRNVRAIMCYADVPVPLADRIRLVGLLEEIGQATMREVCSAFRAADPIGCVLALAAQGSVAIDWRSGPIGPGTLVRLPDRSSPQANGCMDPEGPR